MSLIITALQTPEALNIPSILSSSSTEAQTVPERPLYLPYTIKELLESPELTDQILGTLDSIIEAFDLLST